MPVENPEKKIPTTGPVEGDVGGARTRPDSESEGIVLETEYGVGSAATRDRPSAFEEIENRPAGDTGSVAMGGQSYEQLKRQVAGCASDVRELAQTAGEPLEQFVRENPIKAVLMAAGVGALVGLLFTRK